MGDLYLVGTPIGNLEDITLRALEVLRRVGLIAAEDTRRTRLLLQRYGITTSLTSYYEHNKLTKLDYLLSELRTKDVALVSEAGMPGVSDPGYELVRAAIEADITIIPIPGPSAVITALAASGLPTDQFTFIGFLPRKRGERIQRLRDIAHEPRTIVMLEAPHRLLDALRDAYEELGDRYICLARELTKVHEELLRGPLSEMIAHFEATAPRGEFTLVLAGASQEKIVPTEKELTTLVQHHLQAGVSGKETVERVVRETGVPRRQVYDLVTRVKRER